MGDNDKTDAGKEKVGAAAILFGGAALFSVLVANAGVASRYLLLISLPSVEEILRYLFIWLIFICAALSYREGSLIGITMLADALKNRPIPKRILAAAQDLAVLAFSLYSVRTGWDMAATQFEFGETAVVLAINMGWVTLGVLVGYVLMAYFSLRNLFRDVFDPDGAIAARATRSVRGLFSRN
ncbi:MAG: TRAP transporter small permease [Planctomycetota bacterium]|nr:TRAP transporter small permease [Planctomycetota bacterium]